MKIPVILLNYNSAADCRKCIGFLEKQQGIELEIIVVDNCSPKAGEQEIILTLCREQNCTFIQASENRGYNAGNNIGLRYAAEKGYKYAVIANPDMEFPQTDYFTKMVAKMEEDEEIVVCGSDIVGVDGKRQSPSNFSNFFTEIPFIGHFTNKKLASNRMNHSGICQIIAGCCLMVRLDFMEYIGYFDEMVFLYCEEPILGKQVVRSGKKAYYLHEAQAIHAHIESQKGSFKKRHDAWWKSRYYYLHHYCGYNALQLAIIHFLREIYYFCKCPLLIRKG